MADEVTDAHGLVWSNRGPGTDDHLAWGGHETYLLELVHGMVPEDGIFLDIGAHVGLYSLNMADKAHVTAIEANPKTFEVLEQNVERNKVKIKHSITTHCVAAWDEDAVLQMIDENDKDTGGSTRTVPFEGADAVATGVRARPLDDVLNAPHYRPDFVKIDVEGAEAHVLRGMVKTITASRPVLFIEMHDMFWGPAVRTETLDFLEKQNYVWNDNLTFSTGYYVLATPFEKSKAFEGEVVRAGDSGAVEPEEVLYLIKEQP